MTGLSYRAQGKARDLEIRRGAQGRNGLEGWAFVAREQKTAQPETNLSEAAQGWNGRART